MWYEPLALFGLVRITLRAIGASAHKLDSRAVTNKG